MRHFVLAKKQLVLDTINANQPEHGLALTAHGRRPIEWFHERSHKTVADIITDLRISTSIAEDISDIFFDDGCVFERGKLIIDEICSSRSRHTTKFEDKILYEFEDGSTILITLECWFLEPTQENLS